MSNYFEIKLNNVQTVQVYNVTLAEILLDFLRFKVKVKGQVSNWNFLITN